MARAGGADASNTPQMKMTNPGPKLQELLETTGLNKVFSLALEASGSVARCGSRRLSIRVIQTPDGNLFAPIH
jgi:hypothetical protein